MSGPPSQGERQVLISDCACPHEKDMSGGKHIKTSRRGYFFAIHNSSCVTCDGHCESESPYPGMWKGEVGSKGIPLM